MKKKLSASDMQKLSRAAQIKKLGGLEAYKKDMSRRKQVYWDKRAGENSKKKVGNTG